MERLFSTTVYVFNQKGDQALFINHRKLGKWLPPGGKVDPNELPDDAAIRECFEETGIKVTLLGERAPVSGGLIRPYGMQHNPIIPGVRDHIDFIYLAVANSADQLSFNQVESSEIVWLPPDSILAPNFNTFDSVKTWIRKLSHEFNTMRAFCS